MTWVVPQSKLPLEMPITRAALNIMVAFKSPKWNLFVKSVYYELFKPPKESFQECPYYGLWAEIMETGGKGTWVSIQNLSSFTADKIIHETCSIYETHWECICNHSFKENSLKLSPKYKSSWGRVKWMCYFSKICATKVNWSPIMGTAWCQVLGSTMVNKTETPPAHSELLLTESR